MAVTYHPHWNHPTEELIRVHSMSDDPLVRLLAERLEQVNGELEEIKAAIEALYEKQAA